MSSPVAGSTPTTRHSGRSAFATVEHPRGEQLVDAAVDDRRGDARVDVTPKLAALYAARDDALDEVDRLREVADPRRQLRAATELLDDDPNDIGQMEPRAEDDRRDVA